MTDEIRRLRAALLSQAPPELQVDELALRRFERLPLAAKLLAFAVLEDGTATFPEAVGHAERFLDLQG
jgi:hypothetical protein